MQSNAHQQRRSLLPGRAKCWSAGKKVARLEISLDGLSVAFNFFVAQTACWVIRPDSRFLPLIFAFRYAPYKPVCHSFIFFEVRLLKRVAVAVCVCVCVFWSLDQAIESIRANRARASAYQPKVRESSHSLVVYSICWRSILTFVPSPSSFPSPPALSSTPPTLALISYP